MTTITHELLNPHTKEPFYVDFYTNYNGQPEPHKYKSAFEHRWEDGIIMELQVDWDRTQHSEMENRLIAFHYHEKCLDISEELVRVAQKNFLKQLKY